MTITCRTVLDLRSPLDKYICQTLLLAASWHRYSEKGSRLEVLTIGRDLPLLEKYLETIGVHHSSMPPGRNDDFSRSSNKIEAAYPDPQGHPVLLLDNDVCLLGSVGELSTLSATAIAAAEAGNPRVSDAQWAAIERDLGMTLLRLPFTPVNQRPVTGEVSPVDRFDRAHAVDRCLYLNSGVVLFPSGHDHRTNWSSHQRRINDFFLHHPLRSAAVTTSDQAGFATSVAAHGKFDWLPLRYNYRHGCFRLGLEPADRIAIVHLTGDVAEGNELGLVQRTRAYWQTFILPKIESIPSSVPAAEHSRRKDIALSVQDALLAIIREYELESWLDRYRELPRSARAP